MTVADNYCRNPRHVPLTEEEEQELRRRIRTVAVEGADVVSAGSATSKRKLEEYKLESDVSSVKPARTSSSCLHDTGFFKRHPSPPARPCTASFLTILYAHTSGIHSSAGS